MRLRGRQGVHALLTGLQRFGWTPVMEGPTIIGLELHRRERQPAEPAAGSSSRARRWPDDARHLPTRPSQHLDEVKTGRRRAGPRLPGPGHARRCGRAARRR
ncbi:hypothetical protein ACRAWD_12505 [Caulobacter segnis]